MSTIAHSRLQRILSLMKNRQRCTGEARLRYEGAAGMTRVHEKMAVNLPPMVITKEGKLLAVEVGCVLFSLSTYVHGEVAPRRVFVLPEVLSYERFGLFQPVRFVDRGAAVLKVYGAAVLASVRKACVLFTVCWGVVFCFFGHEQHVGVMTPYSV